MEFLKLILRKSRMFIFLIIILGLVNSILNSGLLMFINNTINRQPIPFVGKYGGLLFAGIIIVSLLVSKRFQTYMIRLTNDILFEFEMNILQKLRYASFEDFEKLGKERVYTAINDARVLGNVPQLFINAFNSLIMVICCLTYMFWIAPLGGIMVLSVMGILLVVYLIRNKRAEKDLNELRDLQNVYYVYMRDLLQGFKEIKMSITRNDTIFNKFLLRNRSRSKSLTVSTSIRYMNNELTGSYSWYIILGVIMFILPNFFSMTIGQVSAFLVTVLYIIGPIAGLITFLPVVTRVKISLNRLNEYEDLLDANVKGRIMHGDLVNINKTFRSIEFRDVTYEYYDQEKEKLFVLGPINLTITRGEKIFITGGNGSGKTTFVKLLTGLYKPVSGKILLNGYTISDNNLPYYRDQLSAIFTDSHIFSENYNGFDIQQDNRKLQAYIEIMKLSEVIRISEGNFQLNDKLSQGQKKRMAMILALMEERQVMILDEWAAEQDPHFRAYFYKKILAFLQQKDKTVIAITHDDAYYPVAGRILKFDYGKIIHDSTYESTTFSLEEPEDIKIQNIA